jgi:NAD(P)-dependent dehydrogenase (short-subunit alcohol dehydrogenase family)
VNEGVKQVVLVTGAGSALGQQVCSVFASQGARVAANDLSPQNLEQVMDAVQAAGGQGREYLFDTGKKMPVQALVSQVVEEWGRLDYLVNASIVQPVVPLLDMDEWDWQRTMEVNLGGAFFAIQVAGRVMRQQGSGAIVNLVLPPESLAGYAGRSALAASQAGLESLTRSAAQELAAHGVRVNAVSVRLLPEATPPAFAHPGRVVHRPLDDPYVLEAVARQAYFLCSPLAREINGRVFYLQAGEWHDGHIPVK